MCGSEKSTPPGACIDARPGPPDSMNCMMSRVTKRDIMQFIESGGPGRASMHAPGGVDFSEPHIDSLPGDRVEPMSKIRRITSDHMAIARRHAAHVTSFFEIDLTRVARIRQRMRAQFEAQT